MNTTVSVKEKLKLNNGTALICELFDDSVITDTIVIGTMRFRKSEFEVENVKNCFSQSKVRNVFFHADVPGKITEFQFIQVEGDT